MKKLSTIFVILTMPLIFAGCATGNIKASPPLADSASAIVIKIPSSCLPLSPCANKTLTFARLNGDGDVISGELYQTSVVRDNHYYLLNAKPGRYVAVAAAYARSMNTNSDLGGGLTFTASRVFGENILFSEELVRQTLVEVAPGSLAVMGEYDYSIEGRMVFAPSAAQFMKDADPVQIHYAKALDPEMETRGVTSAVKFYRAEFKSASRDADTRRKLLESAGKHIGADGWNAHVMRAEK